MKSNTFKVKFFLILFVFHFFSFKALSENTVREVMTSYEIMKTLPYSKINEKLLRTEDGKRADYRTITIGDFNNDGNKEILALALSNKYREYVWGNGGLNFSKGNSYHQEGSKLSKGKEWKADFLSFIHPKSDRQRSLENWDVNIIGESNCIHPAQVLPAHLNQDNILDFVIVCTGYDGHPFPGEHSLVMLSSGLNTYEIKSFTNSIGYFHDGSTADFNNDGILDIMLADSNSKKLKVYINDGNGNFTEKNNYFPQFSSFKTYTTEIFDVNDDGFFDIFLGGFEDIVGGGESTKILLGNHNNKFTSNKMILIPNVKGFGNVMDVVRVKDYLFIVRTGSGENWYKGALIQQVSIKSKKTVSIRKNENMDWIRRIFTLKSDKNIFRFGSLINKTKGLDFDFADSEVKLAYERDEDIKLEGLYKEEDGFFIIKDGDNRFTEKYKSEAQKLSKDRLKKRAARLRIGGYLISNKTPKKYIDTTIELARLRDSEITDGIMIPISQDVDASLKPLVKHQENIDELCGDIQRYSGGGKLFFVLKTNNSERMIHQQCVYNYYKNSKSKIAFSIYRTILNTASGLGKHLDQYNQFKN